MQGELKSPAEWAGLPSLAKHKSFRALWTSRSTFSSGPGQLPGATLKDISHHSDTYAVAKTEVYLLTLSMGSGYVQFQYGSAAILTQLVQ